MAYPQYQAVAGKAQRTNQFATGPEKTKNALLFAARCGGQLGDFRLESQCFAGAAPASA